MIDVAKEGDEEYHEYWHTDFESGQPLTRKDEINTHQSHRNAVTAKPVAAWTRIALPYRAVILPPTQWWVLQLSDARPSFLSLALSLLVLLNRTEPFKFPLVRIPSPGGASPAASDVVIQA